MIVVTRNQPPQQTVELVNPQGHVLNQTATDVSSGPFPVGVGPAGVFLYQPESGELDLLGPTGTAQELGITASEQIFDPGTSAATSPNGRCWILSVISWNSAATEATTQLYVGGPVGTVNLAATLTRAGQVGGEAAGGFRVVEWAASGVLLGSDPTGVGGAGPFIDDDYQLARVVRFDPVSGDVSSPLCPVGPGDRFADLAADGSVACVSGEAADAQITVTSPDGSTNTYDTNAPYAGQVAFAASPLSLIFCTSQGAPEGGGGWTDSLSVLSLAQGGQAARVMRGQDQAAWDESGSAPAKVVSTSAIADLGPSAPGSSQAALVLISLSTGQATTVAPADGILGVL
ncbi:MAG: hypothetical protein WCB85_08055 [Candidatus Dormiibacterota bacterium]